MASILTEIESIEKFIIQKSIFGEVTFQIQYTGVVDNTNTIRIKFIKGDSKVETAQHNHLTRLYEITYYGEDELDCAEKMNQLQRAFLDAYKVVIKDSDDRYVTINSFAISQPFKTQGNMFWVIGMLDVSSREMKEQPTYELINHVHITYKEN